MPRLLFLGSTCADVILRVPFLPRTGDDVNLLGQFVALGGCAYNVCAAARCVGGAETTLFSPVGSGLWGDWVRGALGERGIVTPIPPVADANGCCYCLVDAAGERTFLCQRGAEYRFRPEWLELLGDAPFDGAYLCGLELEEESGDVLLDYLERCPPRRLYFAPGPRLCHIPPRRMARVFAMHPLTHLNAAEATFFTRQETVAAGAAVLAQATGGDVVVTLGEAGAYLLWQGRARVLPAVRAEVRDTIGAGDAHMGVIMGCEALGMPLEEAVARANAAAAAVVSQEGAELSPERFAQWMEEM